MANKRNCICRLCLAVISVIFSCGVMVNGAISAVSVGSTKDSFVSFVCTGSLGIPPQWFDCGTDSTCAAGKIIQSSGGVAVIDPQNGSLTINNVQFSSEKYYSCKRNNIEMNRYRLYVMGKPQCSGKSNLADAEESTLTCSVQYMEGSKMPTVEWQDVITKRRRRAAQAAATMTTDIIGSWDLDNTKQVCVAKLFDHVDQCSVAISVTYAVTNTELMPRMSVIDAGQDVTCSANANPPPLIKMAVEVNGQVEESVTSKWRMMSKWAGNKVKVTCTASNTVDGQQHVDQYDKEYDVKASNYTDPVPKPEESSQASASGAIIAVVVVLVVAVLVIVAAVLVLRKRRSQSRSSDNAAAGDKPANSSQEANATLLTSNKQEQAA